MGNIYFMIKIFTICSDTLNVIAKYYQGGDTAASDKSHPINRQLITPPMLLNCENAIYSFYLS